MQKQLIAIAAAALLMSATAVPALAEGGTTGASGTISLTGGSLSVEAAAIGFTGFALDGTAHNDVTGTTTEWTVKDPTGTGAGWKLNISATDFTNVGGKLIPVSGFEVSLLDENIEVVAGNDAPTSSATTALVLTTEPQKLVSAAVDEGMGTYTLLPTFTLDVPVDTYAGDYSSTVTLQMLATP
jgi:opacity protein-like surface antigen